MNEFQLFLQMGFDHILDVEAYDHILFLVALCALYELRTWKQIAILVTAFTIGHSITLALATFDLISIRFELVEFMIAATIMVTALSNVWQGRKTASLSPTWRLFDGKQSVNYLLALFFGLIHGLGFSSKIKAMLMDTGSIWKPLLAFNLGVEGGQLVVVFMILVFYLILERLLNAQHRDWNLFASGAAAGVALLLMLERVFW